MTARILTALICLPLVFAVVLGATDGQFRTLIVALTALSLFEYFRMAFLNWGKRVFGLASGILIASAVLYEDPTLLSASISVVLFCALAFSLLAVKSVESSVRDVGITVIGALYSGFLTPHLSLLREFDQGVRWLLFVVVPVFTADSMAFFVGSRWGKRPLLHPVSPGKTVEGAAASFVGGIISGLGLALYLFPTLAPNEAALISLVVNILAQTGDLVESLLKRNFRVKDSGTLFPGHGGVLDRTDSLLFPAAFVYFYCILTRK